MRPALHTSFSDLKDAQLIQPQAWIGGQWRGGASPFTVHDPATGHELARVANASEHDAQDAIAAAHHAWPAWKALSAKARCDLLLRWHDLIVEHADDLARIMTLEQGKPLAEARGEVIYGAGFVEWFAQEGRRVYGETIPSPDPAKRFMVLHQPVGVCAAITPWNFPHAMITRKVAPALAAGCTVVIKPAEATPLSALALAELARRAGLPAGVLNVLPADAAQSVAIGQVLCANPLVRHLSFTGSTEVGRILMAQCAPTIKKLSLELGGNAPFLVFDDADLDAAVEGAVAAKYRNMGQTCVCANRFLVQRGIHDAFVARLTERVRQLKAGHGLAPDVQQGPLIDHAALHKVQSLMDDARALGASVHTGGQALPHLGATFFEPTVLSGATPAMRLAQEEIFGPVAAVFSFETEAQAIALANDTDYGLAAYCYSQSLARVIRVSEALEYGIVGINTGLISSCEVPFGGVKQSGLGREGGKQGLQEYLETKYVAIGGVT